MTRILLIPQRTLKNLFKDTILFSFMFYRLQIATLSLLVIFLLPVFGLLAQQKLKEPSLDQNSGPNQGQSDQEAIPLSPAKAEPKEKEKEKAEAEAKSYEALYALGYWSELNKDFVNAKVYYQYAAAKAANSDVYCRLAAINLQEYDYGQAQLFAEKALELEPKSIQAYELLIAVYTAFNDINKVEEFYGRILKINPRSLSAHLNLAKIYRVKRTLSLSRHHYWQAMELSRHSDFSDEQRAKVYTALGDLFYSQHDHQQAIRYYQKSYKLFSRNLYPLMRLAQLYFNNGDMEEALDCYREFHTLYPGNIETSAKMAQIYFLLGDLDSMLKYLALSVYTVSQEDEHGVSQITDYTPVESRMLQAIQNQQWAKAKKLAEMILQQNYRSIVTHYALIHIYEQTSDHGKRDKAMFTTALLLGHGSMRSKSEKIYLDLVKRHPEKTKYHYYLAKHYEKQYDYVKARAILGRLTRVQPDNLDYQLHLVYLQAVTGETKQALNTIEAKIKQTPSEAKLYFLRGFTYYQRGQYQQAIVDFNKAHEIKNESGYLYHLAVAHEKTGSLENSISALKLLIEKDPDNAQARNYLGYLYAENDIFLDEALTQIEKALHYDPENAAYRDSLGWVYYKKGQLDKAYGQLQLAIQLFQESQQSDPVAYEHMGDVLDKKGNLSRAIKAWQKGLDILQSDEFEKAQKKVIRHRMKQKINRAKQQLQKTAKSID